MLRSEVTSVDGLKLAPYRQQRRSGDPLPPRLLAMRGMLGTAISMTRPRLSERFRLSAFDLRGHSASDKLASPASALAVCEDAERFNRELAEIAAAAHGHS